MEELVARLKINLPESMGLSFNELGCFAWHEDGRGPFTFKVSFDNDDCPGSALFIVRGLKALRPAIKSMYWNDEGKFEINLWANGSVWGDTIAEAVAEGLIEMDEGQKNLNEELGQVSTGTEGDKP